MNVNRPTADHTAALIRAEMEAGAELPTALRRTAKGILDRNTMNGVPLSAALGAAAALVAVAEVLEG